MERLGLTCANSAQQPRNSGKPLGGDRPGRSSTPARWWAAIPGSPVSAPMGPRNLPGKFNVPSAVAPGTASVHNDLGFPAGPCHHDAARLT